MTAKQSSSPLTKSSSMYNKKIDENSAFAMSYGCVARFLSEESTNAQQMTLDIGQSSEKQTISLSVDEISREDALELADSKYFEAAFRLADDRKMMKDGCQRARAFYKEHVLVQNPFPPRQKLLFKLQKVDKNKKETTAKTTESVRTSESCGSLLEGTMSLTSFSSHSQLNMISPSHPIDLKRRKSPEPEKERRQLPEAPPKIPVNLPKMPKEENRLMNTFSTPE